MREPLLSRDLLDHQGAGPFGSAVASAFAKIRALLSPRALELVDRMRAGVGARSVGARLEIGEREHIGEIHHAVVERRRLRMRYYSLNRGEESERDVDPYHITYFSGAPSAPN
jgi:predicted DNA-binding transcriptional regulator YafY